FVLDNLAPATEAKRNKWVIKQLGKIPMDSSLLDVGAGEMPYKIFCKNLKYKSQDFGKYTGKDVNSGIKSGDYDTKNVDIISDITDIPVKNDSFDYVLCTEVFEHIPDPLNALKEISRVNKKKLILTAPFASLTHFYPYFFYTGFSEQFYKVNLPKFGYKIEEIYLYGNYFDLLGMELMRLPLIVGNYSKIFVIVLLPLVLLAFPLLILLRILSKLFNQSNNIFCFGICVLAKKP
ncbi:class I SAM-dependent methyltransferase, partial [Candidatus Roizmanbacteria bacterium]|nr:class I SAM-dependent methyltransferase [Candidatus Roizmanbacteria bacterium]